MVDFVASGIAASDLLQLVKLQAAIFTLQVPFAAKLQVDLLQVSIHRGYDLYMLHKKSMSKNREISRNPKIDMLYSHPHPCNN